MASIFDSVAARRRPETEPAVAVPEDLFIDPNAIIPDIDLMIAGGKVYTANPVGTKVQKIIEFLKDHYNSSYRRLKQAEESREFQEAYNQWQKQLDAIHRSRHRGTVYVPTNMYKMPLIVWNGTICYLRYERYFPQEMVGPAGFFNDRTYNSSGSKKIFEFIKDFPRDTKILLTMKQDRVDFMLGFAHCPVKKLIYNPFQPTFHTMGDNKLCIGEANAVDFWNSPIFNIMVNRINLWSPARDSFNYPVDYGRNTKSITLRELLVDKYMVKIEKVEDDKWKV